MPLRRLIFRAIAFCHLGGGGGGAVCRHFYTPPYYTKAGTTMPYSYYDYVITILVVEMEPPDASEVSQHAAKNSDSSAVTPDSAFVSDLAEPNSTETGDYFHLTINV